MREGTEKTDGNGREPMRFTLRLTWVGVGTCILIVLIAGAAVNTGTNLLYLMLATLLSFWGITIVLFRLNTAGVKPRRRLPAEIHAGQTHTIEYLLANSKRRFTSYGLVAEEFPARPEVKGAVGYAAALPPSMTTTAFARVVFPRRGWVALDWVRIVSSFPFGFLVHRRYTSLPVRLLVWPALVPVREFIERRAASRGSLDSNQKGHGSSLYAIRDYAPGDSAKTIHWKSSAKSGTLKAREFEREDARRYRVVLRPSIPPRQSEEDLDRFERAVSLAASLAREFIDQGHEVALWTPSGALGGGTGAAQLRAIMRVLALTPAADYLASRRSAPPPPDELFNDVWIDNAALDLPEAAAAGFAAASVD